MTLFCECGCGRQTKLASESNHRTGSIIKQPLRFIHGHNKANWKGGKSLGGKHQEYIISLNRKHPRQHNGYVLEHILIAEKALGKFLPKKAVLHHINGNTLDNRNINLIICENQAYHSLLHQRKKALERCGNPALRRCCYCKVYDSVDNLIKFTAFYHRSCQHAYEHKYREEKKCSIAL